MKLNNKQRLFEVMSKVDPSFKSKLNESFHEPDGTPIGVDSLHRPINKKENNEDVFKDDSATGKAFKDFVKKADPEGYEKRIKKEKNIDINETGEWDDYDEELQLWKESLKNDVIEISNKTEGKLKLFDVRGFDKYQGPYAIVEINNKNYNIWTQENDMLWIEDFPIDNTSNVGHRSGFIGSKIDIIEMINNQYSQNENKKNKKQLIEQTIILKNKVDNFINESMETTGQLKAKDVKALNLPSGTKLTKVECYNVHTGNLESVDYVLASDPNYDEEIEDLQSVPSGYMTDTTKLKMK